jgi:hypothetical protein
VNYEYYVYYKAIISSYFKASDSILSKLIKVYW